MLFFGISLSYLWGYRLLSNAILSHNQVITEILSFSLAQSLTEKIKDFQAFTKDIRVFQSVQASNAFVQAMSPVVRDLYIQDMDQQWIRASLESDLVQEYITKDTGSYLRHFISGDDALGGMILTDAFGCLVAATDKTTDFYQADEKWWKDSYNGGAGSVVVGDVEFDDLSGEWIIPVSVPILSEKNQVVGILRASLVVERYFAYLGQMRFGKSGHAFLLNGKGKVIVHENAVPMQYHVPADSEFFKSASVQKTITLEYSPVYGKGYYVICSPVLLGQFITHDFQWYVCVEVKKSQIFAPLYNFLVGMLIVAFILILVAVLLGVESGRRFAEPVQKLKQAVERIARGDFNTPVHINTCDEIEILAGTFSAMARDLQGFTDELNKRNEALELSNQSYQEMMEKLKDANRELIVLKQELEDKISHLEQFSKISIGRELRMRELKEKIAGLQDEIVRLKGMSS